jgi:sec-independent protein translocase protein TatC
LIRASFFLLLVPAALNFFLSYSEEVLEPFWSLINILNLSCIILQHRLAFQIPIIQILIGLLNIVSPQQMLGAWRYIIISTIIGAILTPSTDPLTQLLLSSAILLLFFQIRYLY